MAKLRLRFLGGETQQLVWRGKAVAPMCSCYAQRMIKRLLVAIHRLSMGQGVRSSRPILVLV